ncbi:hypothetical protein [Jeotgalibacillus sp. S-D1]|nr:hypothetical protein [Jeotgalibacillus sp. S-D1]
MSYGNAWVQQLWTLTTMNVRAGRDIDHIYMFIYYHLHIRPLINHLSAFI